MQVWRGLVRDAGCDPEASTVDAMPLTAAFLTIAARTKDETRVDHTDASKSEAIDRIIEAVDELLDRRIGAVPAELVSGAVAGELCDALDARMTSQLRHGSLRSSRHVASMLGLAGRSSMRFAPDQEAACEPARRFRWWRFLRNI
jgi:hypothetical protein